MPDNELIPPPLPLPEAPTPVEHKRIAPLWHTIALVVGILSFSVWGAANAANHGGEPLSALQSSQLVHYALSGTLELLVVAWIAFGLFLRKTPFRTLFGSMPRGIDNLAKESLAALIFWICSLAVLAVVGLAWNIVQTQTYRHEVQKQAQHQPSSPQAHKPESPQQQKIKLIKGLMELAPSTPLEIAAWALLCAVVGFSEELVFRGYLQQQGIALLRGIPLGVIFSALIFGAAHGYEGVGTMIQIAVFGALFSILTLMRRNLFPGMLAHGWHDFVTGMALALLRETHFLDRVPLPS
jgi:membrane protease YdiL (CAAX protease family)